jgi:hypothetical protein
VVTDSSRGASPKAADKGAKRSTKGTKRGAKKQPEWVTVATSCDEGDNGKEADNSDKELVATVERDFKRQAWQPADHFENLLMDTFPNHAYPVRHKLKEYIMINNYMTTRAFTNDKKPEGDLAGKAAIPFPEEKAAMSIYGRPAPHESRRKFKLTSQAVNAISPATLEYLRWSESPITFD